MGEGDAGEAWPAVGNGRVLRERRTARKARTTPPAGRNATLSSEAAPP